MEFVFVRVIRGKRCDVAGRHDYVDYPIRKCPLGFAMRIVPDFLVA